ncbi:MAG: hypothetical protein HQK51_05875 [Oligoflexia bacterium]|nr:hypothetical protein [Oligoflexia bacterium]
MQKFLQEEIVPLKRKKPNSYWINAAVDALAKIKGKGVVQFLGNFKQSLNGLSKPNSLSPAVLHRIIANVDNALMTIGNNEVDLAKISSPSAAVTAAAGYCCQN